MDEVKIRDIRVKTVLTKSNLPIAGYSVNPYVGCTHACKYCYACFMKRFTGHDEPWGTFLDVKHWEPIKNPQRYDGQTMIVGSVTDAYNPQEETFRRTHAFLEQMQGSRINLIITTKSDLVLRDLDLIKQERYGQRCFHRAQDCGNEKVSRRRHTNNLLYIAHIP